MLSRTTTPRLAVTSLLIAGLVLFAVLVARSSAQSAPTSSAPAAAGSSGAAGVESGAPIEIPSERVSIPAGDPRQQASRDRAEAARDEKVKKQKTPEAKERRKTAKTKYTNLDSSEALSLARSSFPELLRSEPFEPFHLRGNEKVTKWLGDSAVRLEAGEGEPAKIVESLVPVRVENSSGAMVATDYELEGNADGYRPKTGHARTLLARRVDGGIKLGDIDVTIAPDAAEVGQVEAVKTNDKLFFPGAGRDVDHVVTPLPGGAEFSAILRSEKSPEKLTYRVDLPAGAALVDSKARLGGLEIVKDTQTLALISPPVAWDAADTPVPASYAIKGQDRIELRVEHRNEDYEMPIAVDPTITEDQRYWYTNPSIDKIGWGFYANNGAFQSFSGGSYLGEGLYTFSRGTNYFSSGQFANWQFSAPGNSKITRAEFGYVVHEPQQTGSFPAPYNDDLLAEGIYSPAYNNWEGGSVCEAGGGCAAAPFYTYGGLHYNYRTVLAAGSPGNIAVLQMSMRNTGNHDGFTTYLGSAAIVIDDSIAPIITEKYGLSDSSWTSYREFRARTSDYGLGSKRLVLDSPGNPGWSNAYDYVAPCTGDRRSRCGEWQEVFSSTNGLPEGVQPIRYTGYDVVGNPASQQWNLRLDRTGPTIAFSGEVFDQRQAPLTEEASDFTVTASDGSSLSNAAQRSGARDLTVKVDGVAQAVVTAQACPQSNCAITRTIKVDPDELEATDHVVTVTAADQLGNPSTASFTFSTVPSDEKLSSDDDGSAASLEQVDDGSATCDPDPEAETQYCSQTDDANNPTTTRAALEPPVGTQRLLLSTSNLTRASGPGLGALGTGWGISDQNFPSRPGANDGLDIFADQRFRDLKLASARRIVPWDIVARSQQAVTYQCPGRQPVALNPNDDLQRLKAWMASAQNAGISEFLFSVERTRDSKAYCKLPTRAEYRAGVTAIMREFPQVSMYSAWNEPNQKGQPTSFAYRPDGRGARQAAGFWRDLQALCMRAAPKCTAAAGEFLDDNSFSSSKSGRYFREYKSGLGRSVPNVWAWHPYSAGYKGVARRKQFAAKRNVDRSTARLQSFLNATQRRTGGSPVVWLTEQGGLTHYHRLYGGYSQPESAQRAADDLQFLVDLRDNASLTGRSRLTRFFVYQWQGDAERPSLPSFKGRFPFDTGLVDANNNGATRPLYNVFKAKCCT